MNMRQEHFVVAETPSKPYYPAFDYLRIVLATAVAAGHAELITWKSAGNLSVQIFFALSGWLIGGILLESRVKDLPRFYYNRATRIWIPYFVAVALLLLVSIARDPITFKWIEFAIYKVTFVYNLFGPPQIAEFRASMPLQGTGNHFWSICAEEQFYLLAPIIMLMIPTGRSPWLWLAAFGLIMLTPLWGYFASVALGVAAIASVRKFGPWHRTPWVAFSLFAFSMTTFAMLCVELVPYQIGAPAMSVSLVLALAQPGRHSPVAEFLGGVSYPMYLNHWIGAFIANAIFKPFGLRGSFVAELSAVAIGALAGAALYLLIDRNVRIYRAGFFSTSRGMWLSATGYALVAAGVAFGLTR